MGLHLLDFLTASGCPVLIVQIAESTAWRLWPRRPMPQLTPSFWILEVVLPIPRYGVDDQRLLRLIACTT
jgi:hypothetical protein